MGRTIQDNYLDIISLKQDIEWIKKMIVGIFGAIILNTLINLLATPCL